ncbi:hypothetical protein G9A89_014044 [Geosiphon pyriformis]|nr:hypothetical protein G9A89_014044 [Geosiphon pyriformis]
MEKSIEHNVKNHKNESKTSENKRSFQDSESSSSHLQKVPWNLRQEEWKDLEIMAHLANFGYCYEINKIGKKLAAKFVKAGEFFDEETSQLFIYFKGKELTKSQWIVRRTTLVGFTFEPYNVNSLVKVDNEWFGNFKQMWANILAVIMARLAQERKKGGIKGLFFTGHAIGGAYATFAALYWRLFKASQSSPNTKSFNFPTQLVTFGAPRIGNIVFARFLNTWSSKNDFRVTTGNDHVPHFPASINGNNILKHSELEVWIESQSKNCDCLEIELFKCPGVLPSVNDVKKLQFSRKVFMFPPDEVKAGENEECNLGQKHDDVPGDFFHKGPYFTITMGDCSGYPNINI